MTLYTSDTDKLSVSKKCFKVYLAVTAFVLAFGIVYECFSHGVVSLYMVLAFLIPLVLGVLPFGTVTVMKKNYYPSPIGSNTYHAGIATLTVGSIMKGVLDIYGTTSPYVSAYLIIGIILCVFGAAYSTVVLLISK